jgi:hypothetical protein
MVLGILSSGLAVSAAEAKTSKAITTAMASKLKYLIQEEKLAYDLYVAIYEETGIRQFSNISRSELQHMAAVEKLLTKYGIKNPISKLEPGEFADPELQKIYDDLLSSVTSTQSALEVGIAVEQLDIRDLEKMLEKTMPSAVKTTLTQLLNASYQHLSAFSR